MDYGAVILNPDQTITLRSGDSPKMLSGLDSLVQSVIIELASDPLPYGVGSGFVSGLRDTSLGERSVMSIMSSRIRRARQNLLNAQQETPSTPEEQLKDLRLLAIRPNYSRGSWEAEILISNFAGEEVRRTLA